MHSEKNISRYTFTNHFELLKNKTAMLLGDKPQTKIFWIKNKLFQVKYLSHDAYSNFHCFSFPDESVQTSKIQ